MHELKVLKAIVTLVFEGGRFETIPILEGPWEAEVCEKTIHEICLR